ncbi:hypothetical protein EHW97_04575 [Aeromicrobium camelliae]|uniref:Uncharacterized protein n=1 Tax=Aeromicrobium camelliae TaxID=1538144 RepID=A0A3N6WNF8_9ACTN|nr:hypothetical protein [Aeromicrobium camelliae]RQN08979.1 hypothetical protein EHW97_04575 [Aeromicrobium camelliae]
MFRRRPFDVPSRSRVLGRKWMIVASHHVIYPVTRGVEINAVEEYRSSSNRKTLWLSFPVDEVHGTRQEHFAASLAEALYRHDRKSHALVVVQPSTSWRRKEPSVMQYGFGRVVPSAAEDAAPAHVLTVDRPGCSHPEDKRTVSIGEFGRGVSTRFQDPVTERLDPAELNRALSSLSPRLLASRGLITRMSHTIHPELNGILEDIGKHNASR